MNKRRLVWQDLNRGSTSLFLSQVSSHTFIKLAVRTYNEQNAFIPDVGLEIKSHAYKSINNVVNHILFRYNTAFKVTSTVTDWH